MLKPGNRKWAVAILAAIMCSFIPAGGIEANGDNTDFTATVKGDGQTDVPVSYQLDSRLLVTASGPGSVTDGTLSVTNGIAEYSVGPGQAITLTLKPDDGSSIKKLTLNGKDVLSQVNENQISVKGRNMNQKLDVLFQNPSRNFLTTVKTGDVSVVLIYILFAALALSAGFILIRKKKKQKNRLKKRF